MAKSGNLHQGHRARLRARFLEQGLDGFYDHQILELLLFYAIPRKDTNELAHRLLNEFGSLNKLLNTSPQELKKCGISERTALFLRLTGALCDRYVDTRYFHPDTSSLLVSTESIIDFARPLFDEVNEEQYWIILPDPMGNCQYKTLFHQGAVTNDKLFIQEATRMAHRFHAAGIILVHYLSQDMNPADEDTDFLYLLKETFRLASVPLIDYIVMNRATAFSPLYYYDEMELPDD